MEKGKRIRLTNILLGSTFLGSGVLLGIIVSIISVLNDPNIYVVDSLIAWVFVAIFVAVYVDYSFYILRRGLEMRELKSQNNIPFSEAGTVFLGLDFAQVILILILVPSFLIVFIYTLSTLLKGFQISTQFIVLIGTLLTYLILRLLFGRFFSSITRMKKSLVTIDPNNKVIKVDLDIKSLSDPSKKFLVDIKFREINDIQIFSYYEASAYLKYFVGPDFNKALKQAQGLCDVAKDGSRPEVFRRVMGGSKILFISGDKILYMISISDEDANEIKKHIDSIRKK